MSYDKNWEKEMNKLKKAELIQMVKRIKIKLDSVKVIKNNNNKQIEQVIDTGDEYKIYLKD